MGERKSDIECMGGKIRLNAEPARGKYDGVYRMLDPDKKRPYTNAGLDAALRQRERSSPPLPR